MSITDTTPVAAAFIEPKRPGERVWVTSNAVAELFDKEHKNVTAAIRNVECSDNFRRLNFKPVEIIEKNASGAPVNRSHYLISRDGFLFLAMGFTGKKAAQFKELIIHRFNVLEQYYVQQERKHRAAHLRSMQQSVNSMIDAGYSKGQIKRELAPTSVDREGDRLNELREVFHV